MPGSVGGGVGGGAGGRTSTSPCSSSWEELPDALKDRQPSCGRPSLASFSSFCVFPGGKSQDSAPTITKIRFCLLGDRRPSSMHPRLCGDCGLRLP